MVPIVRLLAFFAVALSLLVSGAGAFAQTPAARGFFLESTVGLDDQSCASDRSLALPPGVHDVIVCLRAINGTRQEFVLHDLLNTQLGVLATDLWYTLGANSDVFYTFPVTVSDTQGITSAWIARGLNGSATCDVAWSVVTVGASLLSAEREPELICP